MSIGVLITKPGDDDRERWELHLVDPVDNEVLASVCLNQNITRYLKSMISMIEDDLPENG